MRNASYRFLVVGAGLAGARAADALSRQAQPGEVALVGAEAVPPYVRPDLSKRLLLQAGADVTWVAPRSFYQQRGIALRLGARALTLDVASRAVTLEDGEELGFGQLLVCTGSSPRELNVPGASLAGVYYLRELDQARALAAELRPGRSVVIVGAGFIGCEVAAACRLRGLEVTMVELAETPCEASLGPTVGEFLAAVHRREGVQLCTNTTVARMLGVERVQAVELSDGTRLSCDFAVVGVGAEPATKWLTGLERDSAGAMVVDASLETPERGIFAAGDIASWPLSAGRRIRVEHETNAQTQGMCVARSMLGRRTEYRATPYVWSRQYDLDVWAVGELGGWDDVTVERSAPRSLRATYTRAGAVCAIVGVNQPDALADARRLVERGGEAAVK
jgi:3-phenylpropionate/trans-cinnamate dioxygenase ferredoxin reductase component